MLKELFSRRPLFVLLAVVLLAGLYFLRGQAYLNTAQAASNALEAAENYRAALSLFPWRVELNEKAGRAYLDAGNAPEAIHFLLAARQNQLLSPEGWVMLGQAYWQNDQQEQAISEWQNLDASGQAPGSLYPVLAMAYHSRRAYHDEARVVQKGLLLLPDHPDLNIRYALLLMTKSPMDAARVLDHAASLAPRPDARYLNLRFTLAANGDKPLAYQLTISGQALGGLGEWGLALMTFENAVYLDPGYASAWAWLGEARQQNDVPGGLAALDRAVLLAPNETLPLSLRGLYYKRQKEYEKALADFETAARLEPNIPMWGVAIADVYSDMNDLNAALANYQKVAEMNPTDDQVWRTLALFCLQHDIFIKEVALPAAWRAYNIDIHNPQNIDLIGQALLGAGKTEDALKMFQRALTAAPDYAPAYLHLGLLYLQTDQLADAETALRKALSLDPNGSAGQQAEQLLKQNFP